METVKKYDNLKSLLADVEQYSLEHFITGRAYVRDLGWVKIELTDELRDKIIHDMAKAINLRYAYRLETLNRTCGLCRRLFYNKPDWCGYCAGQDWDAETKCLREFINKHY